MVPLKIALASAASWHFLTCDPRLHLRRQHSVLSLMRLFGIRLLRPFLGHDHGLLHVVRHLV